jgi:hypothetical protein
VSRRMLGPEIEGEIAQGGFGHNGLASAAGSTLAADAGSRSIEFQFHRADVIDAARTGRASGTSMLLSLLESRKYITATATGSRNPGIAARIVRRPRADYLGKHHEQRQFTFDP